MRPKSKRRELSVGFPLPKYFLFWMAVRFHDLFLSQWWLFSYLYNRNDKTISMRITFLVTSHWLPVAFYLLPSWVPHCATQWRGAETLQQKQAGQQRDRGELSKG